MPNNDNQNKNYNQYIQGNKNDINSYNVNQNNKNNNNVNTYNQGDNNDIDTENIHKVYSDTLKDDKLSNKYIKENYNNILDTTERPTQFNEQTSPKPTSQTYVLIPNSETFKTGGNELSLTNDAISNVNNDRVLPVTNQFDTVPLGKIYKIHISVLCIKI